MQVEDRMTATPPSPAAAPVAVEVPRRPRLWPALLLVAVYWSFLFGSYAFELSTFARFMSRLLASGLVVLLVLAWWGFNRRIAIGQRLPGLAVFIVGGAAAVFLCHPSIGNPSRYGLVSMLLGPVPFVVTVWLLALLLARAVAGTSAGLAPLGALLAAWGFLMLLRVDGLTGDLRPDYHWRWSPTTAELFLAERAQKQKQANPEIPAKNVVLSLKPGDWPGFRGPDRDGVVRGTKIRTDWTKPPRLVWKHRVGPGWSSFVVAGDYLFTQEQIDKREAVVAFRAATGEELWCHEQEGCFWEVTAGAGPRATPCFAGNRLFTLGATGTLSCLDPATGHLHWSRDIKEPSGARVPAWGFSGSPLVVGDRVLVYAGGDSNKGLLAYDAQSGELAWAAPAGQTSYASPQLAKLGGQQQVLVLSNHGLTSVDPATGANLWEAAFPLPPSAPRSLQPHVLDDQHVLIASEADLGIALIEVKHDRSGWSASKRWSKLTLKPSFNDFVSLDGFAYGFDGRVFCCVEAKTGKRRWRQGVYGQGQVLLLADQGLLLVVSEEGAIILLRASPERPEVLGSFQAIEEKTWNHPVVAHGRLYVRNGAWMACYQLE